MHVLVNKLVFVKWHDDGSKSLAVKTNRNKKTMTNFPNYSPFQTDEINS